jgi:hypothetical protein
MLTTLLSAFKVSAREKLGMHEDFSRKEEIRSSSERSFGIVMGTFFVLVSVSPLLHHPPAAVRWWALGISVVFLALAFLWTAPLAPLNRLWSKLGLLLFSVVSPVALGLLFYLTVTPVGFVLRRFGRDPLRLRRDAAAKSYWILRDLQGAASQSMKNQF